ncbi:hypothetical protein GCM10009813_35240 [Brevibacterium marinum]
MTMDSLLSAYLVLMLRSEVTELLRVSVSTLCRWSRDGVGPECVYLSEGSPRYPKGALLITLKDCDTSWRMQPSSPVADRVELPSGVE